VGQLGEYDLGAGWYCYVGSAFGSGGLRGRLQHHLSPIAKPHWHIDYLRSAASIDKVWYLAGETRYEHQWADILQAQEGATIPVPRFGASDCQCQTHLIYFQHKPTIAAYFHADKLGTLHI
jgi:Uri superfamily endonuclease